MNIVTVGGLKEMLKDFPDNFPVIMSIDPEGNGYSALRVVEATAAKPESYRQWELLWNEDGETQPESNVLCLWP